MSISITRIPRGNRITLLVRVSYSPGGTFGVGGVLPFWVPSFGARVSVRLTIPRVTGDNKTRVGERKKITGEKGARATQEEKK